MVFEAYAGMSSSEPAALIKQRSLAAGGQRSREEAIGNTEQKLPRKAGVTQGSGVARIKMIAPSSPEPWMEGLY